MDRGSLVTDLGVTDFRSSGTLNTVTENFDSFIFDRKSFIGHWIPDPFGPDTVKISNRYIIFSFATGEQSQITGKDNLHKKLQELLFTGDTSFITIRQYKEHLQ
jgi:hypothetical protein